MKAEGGEALTQGVRKMVATRTISTCRLWSDETVLAQCAVHRQTVYERDFENIDAAKRADRRNSACHSTSLHPSTEVAQRRVAHEQKTYRGGKVGDLHKLAASGWRPARFWPILHGSSSRGRRKARGARRASTMTCKRSTRSRRCRSAPSRRILCSLHMDARLVSGMGAASDPRVGFEHKTTAFTWVKHREHEEAEARWPDQRPDFHFGQGYWTRANPEDCWLATWLSSASTTTLLPADRASVMEHSASRIACTIASSVWSAAYLGWTRASFKHWRVWGNEVEFWGMSSLHRISRSPSIDSGAKSS